MHTHTDGEWFLTPSAGIVSKGHIATIWSPLGAHVAIMSSSDVASWQVEHNAKMALASPIMVETLRMLITHMESARKSNCPPDNYAIVAARYAIESATIMPMRV